MNQSEPSAERAQVGFESSPRQIAWSDARKCLEAARTYWVATVRPDGRPHVVPVWCAWLDNHLYFSTGAGSRKARNLANEPRCNVSIETPDLHLSVDGTAGKIQDEAILQRYVEVYGAKYEWPMTVRDGLVYDQFGHGGPVFAVTPSVVLGFRPEADGLTATRWRF